MILVEGSVVLDLRKADAVLCGPAGRNRVYVQAQYGERTAMLNVQTSHAVTGDQIDELARDIAIHKNKMGVFIVDHVTLRLMMLTQVPGIKLNCGVVPQ